MVSRMVIIFIRVRGGGTIKQFIKFCIIGLSNTLLSYVINLITLYTLRPYCIDMDYIIGNLVAFLISVLWAFYWNNKYVFSQQEGSRGIFRKLLKTYLAYGFTGVILCNILSYFWIHVFYISKMIVPLLNLFISVPINFLISKYWAYKL